MLDTADSRRAFAILVASINNRYRARDALKQAIAYWICEQARPGVTIACP